MADIFLSYKKERRAHAERLAAVLEAHGYSVWWDYELAVGPDFRDQIEAKLEVSKVVIVLWCSGAIRSKFVRSEASRADKRGKLVQAYLEWVEPPLGFEEAQGQPLVNWSGEAEGEVLSGLLMALSLLLGERRRADNIIRLIGRMEPLAAIEPMLHVQEEEAEPVGTPALVAPVPIAAPARPASASSSRWALIEKSLDARDYEDFLDVFPQADEAFEARRHKRQLADWATIDATTSRAIEAYLKDPIKAANLFAALDAHARAEMRRAVEAERKAAEEREAAERARVEAEAAEPARRRNPGAEFRDGEGLPLMVTLPPGRFLMGSPDGELERLDREGPQHEVHIDYSLAVGKYPVTVREFRQFIEATAHNMGSNARVWTSGAWEDKLGMGWRNPGFSQDASHPVTCINWADAQEYVSWVARQTGRAYRLLSEAEWEYACRAGTTTPFSFGESISTRRANYNGDETYGAGPKGDYRQRTTLVDAFPANAFGLNDMHGNVLEWTQDCWNDSYSGAPSNGSDRKQGDCTRRVLRGGSWLNVPRILRSASRSWGTATSRYNNAGFRVARTL